MSLRAAEKLLHRHPQLAQQEAAAIGGTVQQLAAALGLKLKQAAYMVACQPLYYTGTTAVAVEERVGELAAALGVPRQLIVQWAATYPVLLQLRQQRLADRLQWLGQWLDLKPREVVEMVREAPEYLTARPAALQRRYEQLRRLLMLRQISMQRLLQHQPELLFMSMRIAHSKLRILMAIFGKDLRAIGALVYTTPQLLRTNLNRVRMSQEQLQLLLQRPSRYVFAMCCHCAELLLLPGPKLAARVTHVRQLLGCSQAWQAEWEGLKPQQTQEVLAASLGKLQRLEYVVACRQAQQVGLWEALTLSLEGFVGRFPGYANWRAAKRQRLSQQQQQPQVRQHQHYHQQQQRWDLQQQQQQQQAAKRRLHPHQHQQQYLRQQQQQERSSHPHHQPQQQHQQDPVLGWRLGTTHHLSWPQQRQQWTRLQQRRRLQSQRLERDREWQEEEQGSSSGALGSSKRARQRQQQRMLTEQQQQPGRPRLRRPQQQQRQQQSRPKQQQQLPEQAAGSGQTASAATEGITAGAGGVSELQLLQQEQQQVGGQAGKESAGVAVTGVQGSQALVTSLDVHGLGQQLQEQGQVVEHLLPAAAAARAGPVLGNRHCIVAGPGQDGAALPTAGAVGQVGVPGHGLGPATGSVATGTAKGGVASSSSSGGIGHGEEQEMSEEQQHQVPASRAASGGRAGHSRAVPEMGRYRSQRAGSQQQWRWQQQQQLSSVLAAAAEQASA